jgi:hypothetical protein
VPDFAIVVGVPAKVIKYRFGEEQIAFLNTLRWWDKSDDEIRKYKSLFTAGDSWWQAAGEGKFSV